MLACVPQNPSQTKSTTSLTSAKLNADASDLKQKSHSMRSASEFETMKFSPSTIVELLGRNGVWHKAIALFDSGSDITLLKHDTAKMLKLDHTPYTFKFGTAGGSYCCEKTAIVSLWIR